ncbi:DUF4340 domain-containing protein [Deltaproteobacteria bacterium TL4]
MLKKLFIATLILVVTGGGLWLFQQKKVNQSSPQVNVPVLENPDLQSLSKIIIQGSSEKIELSKGDQEIWMIDGLNYEADSQNIKDLLLKLLEVKRSGIVTDNPKHHSRFHLLTLDENEGKWEEDKTGTLVKLQGNQEPLLELWLGKDRESGGGQYIRYAGQSTVFLIPETIHVDVEKEGWLNKQILNIDGEKLAKSITLKNKEETLHFNRDNAEAPWTMEGLAENKTVKQDKLKELSGVFKKLDFSKIVSSSTPVTTTGRETLSEISMELLDGRVIHVTRGSEATQEDKNYYTTFEMEFKGTSADETLQQSVEAFNKRSTSWFYVLSSWIGEKLIKTRTDLITDKKADEKAK